MLDLPARPWKHLGFLLGFAFLPFLAALLV